MNELAFYNPDELDDDLELVEVEAPKRRRKRRKNPEPIAIATPLLLLIAGYLGWCAYYQSKYKIWNWQPWKLAGRPSLQLKRANPNTTEAEKTRQQAAYDAAVEKMMAASPSVVERDIWQKPNFKPTTEETVSFIEP